MTDANGLASIEEILEDARNGRMFILVDDEDRENEGDLVIPGQFADAEAVNFMAKYGRGLICLAMDGAQIRRLGLPQMAKHNNSRLSTAFTVSIEAREGVTTGISAADRARTIEVAIDPQSTPTDIASPGHVFPLEARDGGVLVRAGHTEAAVDVARLAGLHPSGVICEIMNDDGTMARLPDLLKFGKEHDIKIATIADLIAYRRRSEQLVKRVAEMDITTAAGGDFHAIVYENTVAFAEHIALVKGTITPDSPTLVRMHAQDVLGDVLGDLDAPNSGSLLKAQKAIAEHGSGVIVLIREPRKSALSDAIKRRSGQDVADTPQLRDYGIGAQILLDLGVQEMHLLSNAKRSVVGLEGYGLTISDYKPLEGEGCATRSAS